MELFLKNALQTMERNAVRIYLALFGGIFFVFAIWFSNIGMFPMKNPSDFLIVVALILLLAVYRSGWAFLLFILVIASENITIAPASLGLSLRPYQLLAGAAIVGIFLRILMKRNLIGAKKWHWIDAAPIVFCLAGVVSALLSNQRGASLKQSIVAISFVSIYFLARVFVQTYDDLKKIIPFFLTGSAVVVFYSIYQNIRFVHGLNSFEVMPGRPNGTFAEADWLGMYLVFLLAILLAFVYKAINNNQETITKQNSNSSAQLSGKFAFLKFGDWILFGVCVLYLVILNIALILTVSRSAWLGALIVVLGFLKVTLLGGKLDVHNLQWKNFFVATSGLVVSLVVSFAAIAVFHLTNFQLFNRAQSTGSGLQKITVACPSVFSLDVPRLNPNSLINSSEDLEEYSCRHINLEDVDSELRHGFNVIEVYRPDPNVGIRSKIYVESLNQIKNHPFFGLGWGGISAVLGNDERGAGLNASNIFLETWLGSGLLGFVSLASIFVYVFIKGVRNYFSKSERVRNAAIFLLLAWTAIIVPNLFNAGIFLGFVWVYFGIAVSLLNDQDV